MEGGEEIPLLDLKVQFMTIKNEIMNVITQVFKTQSFILGPYVTKLEKKIAAFLGVKHSLGVSSGTDALLLSLMALGIGPGDGIITTPFTFFATIGSIIRLGAQPIFVDIDPLTYNLDSHKVEQLLIRNDLSVKPKAIMPVHLFGQSADMNKLLTLAFKYKLMVIEDASQAFGAVYKIKQDHTAHLGSLGDIGCFSFFPSKNLGGAGDGGLITCMNDELADKIRSMRNHGTHPNEKYRHLYIGGNFRLDEIQAAILVVKLNYLLNWNKARIANANNYDQLFADTGLIHSGKIILPYRSSPEIPYSHVFNQYVIRVQNRNELIKVLKQAKIGYAIYYPIPAHLLECLANLGGIVGDLPIAEKAAQEVLAIPIYPELTMTQKKQVVSTIASFYNC